MGKIKLILLLIVIIAIIGGAYVYFTATSDVVLDEASPLDVTTKSVVMEEKEDEAMVEDEMTESDSVSDEVMTKSGSQTSSNVVVKDNLESMDQATKAEFNEQMEKMKEVVMPKAEEMPASPALFASGTFVDRSHGVSGEALLIDTPDGKILRFEDFTTVNGPRLHIYLSSDLGDDDFIDLGPIRATNGNVNYEVPDDLDIERYDKALVWCVPFGVLFGYADLDTFQQ